MKKASKKKVSNIGFSTILLVFSMICVVTFSALTLITANSDYRLSQKVANRTTAYYEAEQRAYKTISMIDQKLQQIYFQTHTEKEFCKRARAAIAEIDKSDKKISLQNDNNKVLYCNFSEVITDQQHLDISLEIAYPQTDSMPFYSITQWQSVSDQPIFEEDSTLHLIDIN